MAPNLWVWYLKLIPYHKINISEIYVILILN
ncbi:hypothetical protein OIU78_018262 [Salix suchowensis]|nr:hypothetical protein OIU78_018262 [Salix suchowensis]